MKILQTIEKAKVNFLNVFPILYDWIHFPACAGWFGLTVGIIIQFFSPEFISNPSLFYHKVFYFTIVLLLLSATIFSSFFIRFTCFAFLGYFLAAQNYNEQKQVFHDVVSFHADSTSTLIRGKISSTPVYANGKYSFIVDVDSLFVAGSFSILQQKSIVCFTNQKPSSTSGVIFAKGHYSPPRPAENPNGFDTYQSSLANKIWGKYFCDSVMVTNTKETIWTKASSFARSTVEKAVMSIHNNDYRAIIVASFLNDRSSMSNSIRDVFYKAGIYHLLALSGFNIAILAAVLFVLMAFLPIGKTVKTIIVLICIWLYLFFIGPIPSLLRAVVMTSVIFSAFLFQRKPYGMNSLGLAGMVWLLFSPSSLFTPGYQLSFFATAGLIMIYPVLHTTFLPQKNSPMDTWLGKSFLSTLFVSLAAFFATVPVLAYFFGTLSIAGIITNLFAVALMSVAMWISLIGFLLQIIVPVLVPFCMMLAEFVVDIMIKLSSITASFPWAVIGIPVLHPLVYVVFGLFILLLCIVNSQYTRHILVFGGIGTIILCVGITFYQQKMIKPEVVSFYIKKASVTGIRWPNGKLWLVGCGPETPSFSTSSRIILPWLRQTFLQDIDAIVVFGNYCNTVQNLEPILKNRKVKQIIVCKSEDESCPDFSAFLSEYGSTLVFTNKESSFTPSLNCTCTITFPLQKDITDKFNPTVSVKMLGKSIILYDASSCPNSYTGAIRTTFSQNDFVKAENIIHPMHPLVRYHNKVDLTTQ